MVEGTVVGREGSQAAVPLVGVAVVVKGSLRNHAVTDLQGRYSIRVPSSTDTLQFTYLGYKPLERVVGSRTRLDVEMLSESQQVDAVVVTALGLTRKEKSLATPFRRSAPKTSTTPSRTTGSTGWPGRWRV